MTTAHRPTWTPALASKDQGGNRTAAPSSSYSSRDLPGHKTLKVRQPGQNTLDEISQRNLKEELFHKELAAKRKRLKDTEDDLEDEEPLKKPKILAIDYAKDADDSDDESSDEANSDEDSSDDDDDDEDEIRKELAKIKAERAAAAEAKAQEEEARAEENRQQSVMKDNPLMWKDLSQDGQESDYSLKKKWYEDAVFKNQARNEPKHEKRFINDTVRNDFHRKFLNKYVQ